MRILYVCQRVPYPPERGDKIASYNAIIRLARRHSVTVAALADSPVEIENAAALEKRGIEMLVAEHPSRRARWSALRSLPGRESMSVAFFRSNRLAEQIVAASRRKPFDVCVAFSSSMAQYARLLPDVPLVADFVDVDSRKWALYADDFWPPKSWIYREEARRLLAFEKSIASAARITFVRTRAELDDLRRLIPEARAAVLSNGVDLDYFRAREPKKTSNEIVFTGVMDYYPNVDAVEFFATKVLPLVQREVSAATFTIVGSRPSRRVRRLASRRGVEVVGAVDDVRPYLERACVAVAPLRLARGIQNKVLEALAMSTPAVISTAASTGIAGEEGDGFLVADDPGQIADTTVLLLKNPPCVRRLGEKGRALVERNYVWDDHCGRLQEILEKAAAVGDVGVRRRA